MTEVTTISASKLFLLGSIALLRKQVSSYCSSLISSNLNGILLFLKGKVLHGCFSSVPNRINLLLSNRKHGQWVTMPGLHVLEDVFLVTHIEEHGRDGYSYAPSTLQIPTVMRSIMVTQCCIIDFLVFALYFFNSKGRTIRVLLYREYIVSR